MPDIKEEALRIVLRKKRTEREVTEALIKKGYSEADSANAAAYYRRSGYIDHADYALRFSHDAARLKGHGPIRITRDLTIKGVEPEYIEAALSTISFDIKTPMEARFGCGARPIKEINRIYQYYCRKGFAPSAIRKAMDALYTYE